jgi:signal transduction histidine kinase
MLLRRVLGILLDNALKYTPRGGLVTVATRSTGMEALVEVRDTGIGITPDALPHVFDRFYRADAARAASSGAGLGLSIARRIIELHGGTISVRAARGGGTIVSVILPARPT